MLKKLWVEEFRPNSIDDYVFQNETHKEQFTKYIKEQSIPHLLLKGHKGSGKTTMAFILQKALGIEDGDFKVINASDDNGVDVVRNSVKVFCQSMPLGDFKIVFLDEADFLTVEAQKALCRIMEQYSDSVRFILTCNRPHKILDEVKSRCTEFEFKSFDKKDMARHVFAILQSQNVKVNGYDLLMKYVEESYPDMRKLINNLENNVFEGTLREANSVDDQTRVMVEIIEQLNKGKWLDVRASLVSNIVGDEWDEVYRFMYDNLDQITGFDDTLKWKQGIVIIADHLRFHAQVADPEINFSACMIRLSNISESK